MENMVKVVCNYKQAYTQYGGLRPFGVAFLFAGWDKHHGFQLYQVSNLNITHICSCLLSGYLSTFRIMECFLFFFFVSNGLQSNNHSMVYNLTIIPT